MLDDLIARVEAGEISAEDAAGEAPLHRGESVAVTIYLSGNVDGVVRFLQDNGVSPRNVGEDYIEAFIPILLLPQTSEQPGVLRVEVVIPAKSFQGATRIAGNGPAAHGSPAWNQAGYRGQGIKVGIIDGGFEGFSGLMGTELPQSVRARCYPEDNDTPTDEVTDCAWDGAHGTVVAESVMDISPEVALYIANSQSKGDLQAAVQWMIDQGVNVINHSVGWPFDGPGDGTSPNSWSPLRSVDRAVDSGIVWVNAAGNDARTTWFGSPSDADGDGAIEFAMDDEKYDFDLFCDLPDCALTAQLRWDDSWSGAVRDLDFYIYDRDDSRKLGGSDREQSGSSGETPFESISGDGSGRFYIGVVNRSSSLPSWIQLTLWGDIEVVHYTDNGSITNPAESKNSGMLTVGAAHWEDVDAITIRFYSSRGPTPDGRTKPDLVAADCGETAAESSPFCGTSQASPHVAGMAALVRQRFPDYTPAQVVSYLKENAEQRINSPDPNNTWGHGFMVLPPPTAQLIDSPSIQSIGPGANSLTVSWAAPTSDGGSAITAYDLRHIEASADETVDANWTVAESVWTSGSGALSYEVTGLTGGTQYDVQVRSVSSAGDGQWSATVTGTPLLEGTACATGGAVADPANNPGLVSDCDTLLEVRDTLAGSGMLNWAASTPITNWNGVDVSGTPQRVTLLYLPHQGLSGTLPLELGSLTGLEQLTLVLNQLTGPIPSELGSLTSLTQLHLFSNRLTGPIPAELGSLTMLQGLELYDNRLTGSIPSEFGDLTNLQALHIDSNQLTGTIPAALGRLSNLQWLTLHDNQLTGEIPVELGRLTNLEQLWLAGNQFTGCVPAELRSVASTDRTHRLEDIGIPYCDVLLSGLSITPGTLSPQFDEYAIDYSLAAQSSQITVSPTNRHNATFEYLDGDDNVLADADRAQAGHQVDVPAGRVTTIKIKVTSSDRDDSHTYTIHVTGPGALGAPAIDQITPGTNSLTVSWTPPSADGGSPITAYDLRHIETSADETVEANWPMVEDVWTASSGALSYELTGLTGGTQYDVQVRAVNSGGDGLWSATATGTLPQAGTDCATGGAVPDGANNPGLVSDCETLLAARDTLRGTGKLNWSASTPITDWKGVTVGGTPMRVTVLHLSSSGLNGEIPAELGNLSKLTVLGIWGTQLSGRIPAELGNLTNLKDLSLSFNKLSGEIPTELGNLSKLTVLWLESNQLTGEIPAELGNLSDLVWLYLNDNQLSGEIPAELGSLSQLERLYFSSNQLTGCLPAGLRDVVESDLAHLGLPDCGLGTAPGAPTGLTATANGQTQIDLTWNAPSDDGGSAVTGYHIEVSEAGSSWSDLVGDTRSTANSYSHTGLTPGVTRHYRVSAINSAGTGTASNVANAATGVAPVADLVVDTPTVTDGAPDAGARITLRAKVRNQGSGRSDSATLRYYQSTDSTITTGDTEVGTDSVFGLAASASGDESVSLTAPSEQGTYYYGACVDAVSDESDTQNNCSPAVTVTIGAAPAPDLVVDAPTVSESAPAAGDRITLRAKVRNQGSGRSDSATLRYYQSTDSTITTGDTEVGTDSVFGLAASASGDESISLDAPSTPGTYYYGACVDAVADESDAQNNCSPAVTVTVGAAPAPDLVVDAPTVSESAPAAGGSFTLSATVRNQGAARSASTTLRYYQSTDSTITIGDTEVGTDSVFGLAASWSGDESISLTAPSTPGTYYYGACIDVVSDETDATNNCSAAVTVTVGAAPAPDLVVDTPTVSESAPAAGASFTLSATVRNQGNGRSDSTTLRYYQSTDSTITIGDTEVGTDSVFGLAASWSGDESISLTAPSTPGTYYYGACIDVVSDETDATNNCSAAVTVTVGAAPAPDLVVDTPTVSESAPAAGASFTLSATVRNQGNGRSDSTTLRYYQSTDSTITIGDTEVGTDSVFGLAASWSGDESISLTAPSTPGTYYYGACIDVVSDETDATNNCSAAVTVTVGAAPAPDLVVDTPTVSESAPAAGASFTLSATVRNQGNGRSDSTTLRYYRSTDSTITTGDTEVDTDYVSRLDASESGDESVSLTAPDAPGTYYYGACVDAVSDETDTTNNCSPAVTVTVGAAPAPDLVVDTPTVSESAPAAGASFTLSATVRNQGNGRSDSTTLRYYRSTDSTITNGDTEVGMDSVFRLVASGSGAESISLTAPSTPGTYYYGACVDVVSDETDATNNCSAAVTVTVGAAPAPDLVVDTPTVSESAPAAGASFTLSATVRNQGAARSDSTTLHYYQSTDSTITTGDTEVGTDSVFGLAASASGDESISLTAPSTPGTYYYGACVDEVNGELDTQNNCSLAVTLTVGVAPAPDLVVDTPTVSESAPSAGASFTLSATIRNQGAARSASTTLRYYQSSDATITIGDTEVGTDSVFGLAASRSGDESISLTAPSTPGTYYFGACVETVTGESDTTNNCSPAATVTVQRTSQPPQLTGDVDDKIVKLGDSFTVDLSGLFTDPDGDDITSYGFTFRTGGILSGIVNTKTGILSLRAIAAGETIVAVYARDSSGVSGASQDLFKVTVTAAETAEKPGAPTGVTATADGQTQIDLSWTAPSDDGGADITGYKIEVSTDGSSWSDLVANTGTTTTGYSHSGLTAGTTRHYRVSAINSAGTGPASNVANATTDSPATQPGGTGACANGRAVPDASNNPGLVSDCDTLLEARDTLSGTASLNWSADTPIASWDAVTVSGTPRRVTKIDTSAENLNLSGTIPVELGNLSSLTNLRLSNNELTGTIPPELGSLSSLRWLSLWNNKLTGTIPAELGSLTNLTLLRLEWNELTGTIPPQLGSLTNLDSMYLGGNRLTGTIPAELGRLTKLQALILGGSNSGENQLTGTIPTEFRNLTKLQSLNLWNNRVSGTIPAWLGSLSDLTTLILSGNQFTGPIPTELGNLTKVRQLWLAHNQLTGTIPRELGNLTNVTELHLDDNRLTGDIPADLAGLAGLRQLFLANNQLTGCIPAGLEEVAAQHDLAQLDLPDCDTGSSTAVAPGMPAGLTATVNGQTRIDLSWTAPSGDGGAAITGYKIEVSTDGSSWSDLVADTGSTSTSYSHTGLASGSTRYYRVSAINSAGTGTASNVANASTEAAPATRPGAPTGLAATANGQTEIDLSWTAPSDDGGAAITGYKIEVSTDGSSWSALVANTRSTGTSYSHTGLTAGSTRHYRVFAINSAGTGPASSSDSATTDDEPVSDGTCTADLIVEPGERCTYPGTSTEFSVASSGTGRFLLVSSGTGISIINSNINGVMYTFVASKQSDGNWLVEEVG